MDKVSQYLANDVGVAKALAYSGILLVISLIVAQGFLMGFIPPPSPNLSAEELTQIFIDRKIGIRIGTMIECIGFSFWGTWAISIVVCMRRMERGIPVLIYASIANAGGAWVFFLLTPITWAMIAFRPKTMDPKFIQILNDYIWFLFNLWCAVLRLLASRITLTVDAGPEPAALGRRLLDRTVLISRLPSPSPCW